MMKIDLLNRRVRNDCNNCEYSPMSNKKGSIR